MGGFGVQRAGPDRPTDFGGARWADMSSFPRIGRKESTGSTYAGVPSVGCVHLAHNRSRAAERPPELRTSERRGGRPTLPLSYT